MSADEAKAQDPAPEPTVDELAASEPTQSKAPAPAVAPEPPALGDAPGPIGPADTFAAAGRKAMWPHVDRLLTREAQLADPEDTDGLKRYRVATRRLRAALRVFREAFPGKSTRPIRRGLSELADAVGAVRDLDVRIAGVREWASAQEPELTTELEPLTSSWAAQREAAAASLLRRLATRRHARNREDLVAFVIDSDSDAPPDESPARTIRDRAGSETWAAFERVRAYATVVRWADLATLHQLRIEAKRLRYTIEFLGTLLGDERERLVAQLVALQDHLGAMNDAAIAADATRSYLADHHAALAPGERAAIERYLIDRERTARQLRRGLGRFWRPIASATFARLLARAVAGPTTRRRRTAAPRKQP